MVLGPGERATRNRFAGVVEIDIALVEKQEDAAVVREVNDALEVFRGNDRAGGIRRRVEDDGLGARA